MPKAKYIIFHCGKYRIEIKRKVIGRYISFAEALKARDEYIRQHPELKIGVNK